MTPIVFCASFVPWVNATKPAETTWSRRKILVTIPGRRVRKIQRIPSTIAAASTIPSSGDASDGRRTFSTTPSTSTTSNPFAAIAAPSTPPINAWLELVGSPMYHVNRFQVIAPTTPARTTSSVIASASTIPVATVAATSTETSAQAKFRIAANTTATRGDSARVETLVAIAFAASWKPFVKSKNSATTMTATRVRSTVLLAVLDQDRLEHVARCLERVYGLFQLLVDVFPADDRDRVLPGAEELRDGLPHEPVTFVLEDAELAERVVRFLEAVEVAHARVQCRRGAIDHVALLARPLGNPAHVVQLEVRRCVVDVVADVVERGREPEDVVSVERRHERPVDEPDQLGRQLVAVVLALLDPGDQLAAVLGVPREQLGEESGDLDDVARGLREQLEEPSVLRLQT